MIFRHNYENDIGIDSMLCFQHQLPAKIKKKHAKSVATTLRQHNLVSEPIRAAVID